LLTLSFIKCNNFYIKMHQMNIVFSKSLVVNDYIINYIFLSFLQRKKTLGMAEYEYTLDRK